MNIKFKNNLTYYIIFNIHEEKKLQKYLFSLDNGIGWGNWLGKEINSYYSGYKLVFNFYLKKNYYEE